MTDCGCETDVIGEMMRDLYHQVHVGAQQAALDTIDRINTYRFGVEDDLKKAYVLTAHDHPSRKYIAQAILRLMDNKDAEDWIPNSK